MPTQTRVVRLLQNTLYPTYQLHVTMSNKQTVLNVLTPPVVPDMGRPVTARWPTWSAS